MGLGGGGSVYGFFYYVEVFHEFLPEGFIFPRGLGVYMARMVISEFRGHFIVALMARPGMMSLIFVSLLFISVLFFTMTIPFDQAFSLLWVW